MKKRHLRIVERNVVAADDDQCLFTGRELLDKGEAASGHHYDTIGIHASLLSLMNKEFSKEDARSDILELRKMIFRIRSRTEHLYSHPLVTGYYRHDVESAYSPSDHYYVAEKVWHWLIIPRYRYHYLFIIYEGFSGGAFDKKEFSIQIFDERIAHIAREEVEKFRRNTESTGYDFEIMSCSR